MALRSRIGFPVVVLAVLATFALSAVRCFVGLSLLSQPKTSALPRGAAPGPPLTLTDENIEVVLQEARYHHLQNCFGYVEESSGAGITGKVDLVEVEGPMVYIHLYGAFWHNRADVLRRVKKYLMQRIPEIAEVDVSDPDDLIDEGRDEAESFIITAIERNKPAVFLRGRHVRVTEEE
eukprot:CAMPEP_0114640810 /NCGR_PEP_ID=MMETSP0191-20121206/1908_1 /TAXON_ID=126664 /ORGANISM="Sorites sp." /LENGTH=177 /DNA_ID=CAMNT_0001852781 /DNA_START=26 /DNA_END=557 /DNA_ORIENTATION=+